MVHQMHSVLSPPVVQMCLTSKQFSENYIKPNAKRNTKLVLLKFLKKRCLSGNQIRKSTQIKMCHDTKSKFAPYILYLYFRTSQLLPS